MSLVELRVELPAYSHSFVVQVPQTCTILDVKQAIFQTCIGAPRVDGQRIIYRGRYLVDHETVQDLWKSPDEPRIIHLAVHPSAWTSNPPVIPLPRQPFIPPPLPSFQIPRLSVTPQFTNSSFPLTSPLAFVRSKHQLALLGLFQSRLLQPHLTNMRLVRETADYELSRTSAIQVVERYGWSWPTVLDEDYPAITEGGLTYERATLDGLPYLRLTNPTATPTMVQIHALKILTYTYPILSLPTPHPATTSLVPLQQVALPLNINPILQQLALPHLQVAPNHNQNGNQNGLIPDIAIRPLLASLLMLGFRALLLVYFFAPVRKPVFGIFIFAWMMYEMWQPIRNFILRGWRQAVAEDLARQNRPARPLPNAGNAQGFGRPAMGQEGVAPNGIDAQATAVLDSFANINIQNEEHALASIAGASAEEPSFAHKVITFVSLLAVTVHPAVWNRRRVALRQREGRIRAEASARETQDEDGAQDENRAQIRQELVAQHTRRSRWVRNYVDRVTAGEWVDELD